MSALAELTIFPTDKGASLSTYVARAVKIIKESGLPFQLGPMGTAIEGPFDRVMDVVSLCMKELQKDSDRIYLVLKMDFRKGAENRLTGKVESVMDKIKGP